MDKLKNMLVEKLMERMVKNAALTNAILRSKSFRVICVSICCAAAGYVLNKLYGSSGDGRAACAKDLEAEADAKPMIKTIEVPAANIGLLIGHGGRRIRAFEHAHEVTVDIGSERGDLTTTISIRGRKVNVATAEAAILAILGVQTYTNSDLFHIPRVCLSKIVGANATPNDINTIRDVSGAVLTVCESQGLLCPVRLFGTDDQIQLAKDMVIMCVAEYSDYIDMIKNRRKWEASRSAKKLPVGRIDYLGDGPIRVHVSLVTSPSHFWVQLAGPMHHELNALGDEMRTYYEDEFNRQLRKLNYFEVGSTVATVCPVDQKWYRSEVLSVLSDGKIKVLFLDYGDTAVVAYETIYELYFAFHSLRAQAVECFLHGIEPIDAAWSTEAINAFEALINSVKRRLVTAVVQEHNVLLKNRNGTAMPGIDLIAAAEGRSVNFAQELVFHGFAKVCNTEPGVDMPEDARQ